MTESGGPLLSSWCAESERTAFVVGAAGSVWLYLSAPGDPTPAIACWVFNTPDAEPEPELARYEARGDPPPVPATELADGGVFEIPPAGRLQLAWGPGGQVVALSLDDEAVAVLSAEPPRALCRFLRADGPWGDAWDDAVAANLFDIELPGLDDA